MARGASKDSVNDRMVKWTALPAVYLWLAASGAVVTMGILKPEVVLENIEGFIALIAIIGGTAQPAFATMLELWKAEQQTETELHPSVIEASQRAASNQAEHARRMEMIALEHKHALEAEMQKVNLGILEGNAASIPILSPVSDEGDEVNGDN